MDGKIYQRLQETINGVRPEDLKVEKENRSNYIKQSLAKLRTNRVPNQQPMQPQQQQQQQQYTQPTYNQQQVQNQQYRNTQPVQPQNSQQYDLKWLNDMATNQQPAYQQQQQTQQPVQQQQQQQQTQEQQQQGFFTQEQLNAIYANAQSKGLDTNAVQSLVNSFNPDVITNAINLQQQTASQNNNNFNIDQGKPQKEDGNNEDTKDIAAYSSDTSSIDRESNMGSIKGAGYKILN